jgi:hypothetical protein
MSAPSILVCERGLRLANLVVVEDRGQVTFEIFGDEIRQIKGLNFRTRDVLHQTELGQLLLMAIEVGGCGNSKIGGKCFFISPF